MFTALIAGHHPSVAERVEATLRLKWPSGIYRRCDSGMTAADAARDGGLNLIVLDLGVRTRDALDALALIRRWSAVPVLTIAADSDGSDWERGVDLGADEYVARSFSPIELLARTKAVVGRRGESAGDADRPRWFDGGCVSADVVEHLGRWAAPVRLTWPEVTLMRRLAVENGRVVPTRWLEAVLWDHDQDAAAYLRVYVRRLRERIELEPDSPRYLVTERGLGYRFVRPGPSG